MAFAAIRVKRLDDWKQVGTQEKHGKREGYEYDHCDPARRHLNQFGTDLAGADGREVAACMQQQIEQAGAKQRKGAAVGAHLLAIASPEYFRPGDPSAVGTFDTKRVEEFRDATLSAIRKRYGPIAAWRLDLDEATPHLDVFLVPMSKRETKTGKSKVEVSYRDAFGGTRHKLEELQTWFAGELQHLGLKRGEPRSATNAKHVSPRDLHKRLVNEVQELEFARIRVEERERQVTEREREVSLAEKLMGDFRDLVATVREKMPAWQKAILRMPEPQKSELLEVAKELGREVVRTEKAVNPFLSKQGQR